MNNELTTRYVDASESLSISRPPDQVLAEAKKAADALTKVIAGKKNPVKFNQEIYLEFEDWQIIGKFYGVTVKVESTNQVNFGDVNGFEATAVAIDRDGREVSRAESLCLTDEENWGMRPKYEWQDELDKNGKKIWDDQRKRYRGTKVKVADVPTPMFQLKSMAQTRACAKALRQVFAWVVVLAGYKPNVAEEMTGNERELNQDSEPEKPQPDVQRKSEKAKTGGLPPVGQQVKKDDVICAECRMKNGAHESICSQHPDKKKAVPENAGDAYEGPESGQAVAETKLTREEQWTQFAGHDEKEHISFKQGGLLFVVQGKVGITDDQMKDYLKKHMNIDHRPLIPRKMFNSLLDAIDPEFKHHEEKK